MNGGEGGGRSEKKIHGGGDEESSGLEIRVGIFFLDYRFCA